MVGGGRGEERGEKRERGRGGRRRGEGGERTHQPSDALMVSRERGGRGGEGGGEGRREGAGGWSWTFFVLVDPSGQSKRSF